MESLYGSRDFLAFYLAAAVVSTLGWTLLQLAGHQSHTVMVGASGAVMAVVTLYTLYYPRREILFFFIPMPMWALLLIYLVVPAGSTEARTIKLLMKPHLIGAAFGFLYKQFDLRWSRLVDGRFRLRRPKLRIFSPVPFDQTRSRAPSSSRSSSEGAGAKSSTVSVLPEEQLDARLDEVLAKIARDGRSGLTDDDHRVLQEASRRARNKRSDHH